MFVKKEEVIVQISLQVTGGKVTAVQALAERATQLRLLLPDGSTLERDLGAGSNCAWQAEG